MGLIASTDSGICVADAITSTTLRRNVRGAMRPEVDLVRPPLWTVRLSYSTISMETPATSQNMNRPGEEETSGEGDQSFLTTTDADGSFALAESGSFGLL